MIKNVKICGKIIMLMLMLFILSSCSEKSEDRSEYEDHVIFTSFIESFGSDGYAYVDVGKNMAHFVDAGNGTDATVCFKPDCSHNEEECPGYLGYRSDFLFFTDKNEYFTAYPGSDGDTSAGVHDISLMKADLGGTNRKEIFRVKEGQQGISASYRDGYLAYAYRETDVPERIAYKPNEELDKYRCGLYLFDMENEKTVQVEYMEATEGTISTVNIEDGKLYYLVCYYDEQMNLEGSEIDWNAVMEFRKDNEHQKLYSYDIETTEKTLIWEGTMENVLLRGEAYMISDEYNGTGIRYILMDGKLTVPAHKEKLSEKISNPGITGIYFYKGEVFLVCDGKIEIYDIESGEINEPESQGKNEGLMRVDAIVGERVYFSKYSNQMPEIYCIGIDDFRRAELSDAVRLK